MMKKLFYTTPEVEIVEIAVEGGFGLSGNNGITDYEDGGNGVEMD